MYESAEKSRSKNEIIESAKKIVNENLRKHRGKKLILFALSDISINSRAELSMKKKEEQERQRQESEERKLKIMEFNEMIKNKNKRASSGSPSNHKYAWGVDQIKVA